MKAFKSGLNRSMYLLLLPIIVGLWACASSYPSPLNKTDKPEYSITGTWEFIEVNPMGKANYTVIIVQDGEKLSVTLKKPTGEDVSVEGKIKERSVEWRFSYESTGNLTRGKKQNPQTRDVQFKGKINKDGTMSGNIFLQGKKGPSWTAKIISK